MMKFYTVSEHYYFSNLKVKVMTLEISGYQ